MESDVLMEVKINVLKPGTHIYLLEQDSKVKTAIVRRSTIIADVRKTPEGDIKEEVFDIQYHIELATGVTATVMSANYKSSWFLTKEEVIETLRKNMEKLD